MLPFKKILCPTDFSQASNEAVKAAIEIAEHFGSELWFIHAVSPIPVMAAGMEPIPMELILADLEREEEEAKKRLEEITARFKSRGLKARLTVLKGEPAEEILRTAGEGDVDLIVTSTHGHTGLTHLVFGSVAEKVVRLSPCPVLAIRSDPEGIGKCAADSGTATNERPLGKEAGNASEKSAGDTLTYLERLEGKLKEWETAVGQLAGMVEAAKTDMKTKYARQIDDLKGRQEAAHKMLIEMRKAGETAWEGLEPVMEKTLRELKETYDGALLKFKATKEKAQDRISTKKQVYAERAEAELREWGATIELLKAKANRSRIEAKAGYMEEVERLQDKQKQLMQKLQELRGSGDEAWTDLKDGLERAFHELKESVTNALSRFKENR